MGAGAPGEGVSARREDTVGLRKGRGEGRGRTICFAAVICGGPWGRRHCWQDDASPNVSPGSGGQTVFMVNLDGGGVVVLQGKEIATKPRPPRVQNKHSSGMHSKVLGLGNVIFIFIQGCGWHFSSVLLCSGSSHQGACKLCLRCSKRCSNRRNKTFVE